MPGTGVVDSVSSGPTALRIVGTIPEVGHCTGARGWSGVRAMAIGARRLMLRIISILAIGMA